MRGPACSLQLLLCLARAVYPCGDGLEYLHRSLASRKRRQKGNPVPGVQLGHPVPGGYKYWDLALQIWGISDETVKYGREFCGTSTSGKALKQLYSEYCR
jgi:hypothetical protein